MLQCVAMCVAEALWSNDLRFKRQSTYFSCFSVLQCVAMRVAEGLWSKGVKFERLVSRL